MLYYPKTLFRFPLRTNPSELSEVVYTFDKIEELIEALRGEATFLLPFLRSVNTIEVYRISREGIHSLTLKVEVASSCRHSLHLKRQSFLEKLKSAHSRQSYGISSIIDFNADFHINVTDHSMASRSGSSHFLVVSTVGSTNASICQAATKQKVFPWVGTALQLNSNLSNDGRIFCFLPMPVDAASKLPVHVNGTFGLNDDRRSMKWPGLERKNDPTANWNHLLVSELLPSCYVKLLLIAKDHQALTPEKFYQAWPEVKALKGSHWERILLPLFHEILKHHVLRSERTEALRQVGEWVTHSMAVLTPALEKLPSVVRKTLSNCGVKLVTIPQRIRSVLSTANCVPTEVSPSFARGKLRSNPISYISIDPTGKRELLRYCLRDKQYKDIVGVNLLPLANGNFIPFQTRSSYYACSTVYLVNSTCPRYLLPEQDHILVDVSDDSSLHSDLEYLASSNCTQLALLTASDVARLLPQSMPSSWQRCSIVTLDNHSFPSGWFEKFWNWVNNQNLNMFEGQFVLQTGNNHVVRLRKSEAVLFIPNYYTISPDLLSAFNKLGVKYSLQRNYSHLNHKSLSNYVNQFNADGILDSIYAASTYGHAVLTDVEAQALLSQLCQNQPYLSASRRSVLQGLAIFKSSSNCSSRLCSLNNVNSSSLLRKALVEPPNLVGVVSKLPNSIILLSRNEHYQMTLMNWIGVEKPTETNFLLQYIFPLIRSKSLQDYYVDALMGEILSISQLLLSRDRNFLSSLSQLPFVSNGSGNRLSPVNLFDPSKEALKNLYKGERVFPTEPYNSAQWLQFLRQYCGLRTSVRPDEILSIISSIKLSGRSYPHPVNLTQHSRAKAILQYISTSSFQSQATDTYSVSGYRSYMPFPTALNCYASAFSWLPVLSERPSDYPSVLPWKGEGCSCHFFTLNTQGAVMTSVSSQSLSYIVGSQVYLTDPKDTPSTQLSGNNNLCAHVIEHLKVVICHHKSIPQRQLSFIMNKVYSFLNSVHSEGNLQNLRSISKWIYIAKHNVFVSPSVVAIDTNNSFRQNLEPYLFILPESLSPYSSLFTTFGVSAQATQSQIIAVLSKIRESITENNTSLNSSHVWNIVMSILNWISDNGTNEPNLSDGDQLYVPTESDSEWPRLMKSTDVVYTDNDFLKNFLKTSSADESYTFVHSRISSQMAKCLGITPLSDYLDITEDTFEDTGQHEPLTVRLKNILRDYKDGLTIAKELLQNADDAEATEVNFCYDARNHKVDPNSLFFPEMIHAHGPALLVHNNKTFSKEDFENITKLAAATKQDKPLKIGKFGIGFCSVYHITDVPSFLSQDSLTIFDPTMTFLKKEIKNPSRPGKRVKFTSRFIKQSRQLAPYDGLFGFHSQQQYNGTLFRLPFRTSASELSGTCYTEDYHIKSLIEEMKACSSNLILFLQHVNKITFQVIKDGESLPTVVIEIVKSVKVPSIPSVTNTCVKEILCTSSQSPESCSYWIVSSHSATLTGKHATATVATSLLPETSGSYKTDTALEGELFCFLPLSQKTGLPVHVSCNFAVINNRQGIWTSDDTSYISNEEVHWNVSLMQSVIPQAYHQLLLAIKHMHGNSINSEYLFYSLWPLKESLKLQNPWTTMITKLYELILSSNLFYSSNTANWLHLSQSKFLSPDILRNSTTSENDENDCISEILKHLQIPVVYLPMTYRSNFHLEDCTICENDFLRIFFKNLDKLSPIRPARDQLILLMLEVYAAEYDDESQRSYTFQDYFKSYACIPCAPDGHVLKKCSELIDPNAPFAKLYNERDNRFPIQVLTDRHLACSSLIDLGMKSEKLPYECVVERAQTIYDLYRMVKDKAKSRIKLILRTIDSHMEDNGQNSGNTLDSIPFLPVLSKPRDYPLSWAGDGQDLMKGKNLMIHTISRKHTSENNGIIAGTQVAFVCEESEEGCGELNTKLQKILKIRNSPSCNEVVQQIKQLVNFFNPDTATDDLRRWMDHACRQAYKFLEEKESDEDIEIIKELTAIPCVWSGKVFLQLQQIAKSWKLDGPYLHSVPSTLALRKKLCNILGIREDFSLDDVNNGLSQMRNDFGDKPVCERSQHVLKELVSFFSEIKPKDFSDFKILLPDEKYVLMWSTDLAYNDAPWAPKDNTYRYVNDIIPRRTAMQLHVKPIRAKLLEKYVNEMSNFRGVEFGQREELTRRIQNILRDYPFDVTVLKELLQNADDAKATKMYVILDKRTHGTESVLSEKWRKLQGPSMLVWNDSVFSEKDIRGIQELGLGSKRSEAESIGQYGIGFNSVYHLTDCPSFVSNGDTLCVMDPHCMFVHGATPLSPGRRFDKLKSGFWDDFKDMKSAYLRSNISDVPCEILEGSLFRFPLRITVDAVKSSKIAADLTGDTLVTASKMYDYVKKWAPKIKDAMFFLNNVREIRFFVIEKDNKLKTEFHYRIEIAQSDKERCQFLHQKITAFTEQRGCEPCVVRYPITVIDIHHVNSSMFTVKEKWIIQQGIGDIEKKNQTWSFVENVKPRHGIAAQINSCSGQYNKTYGQVFCFLPLPVMSHLPVHINGHFILNSTRRDLWHTTNPGEEDGRSVWNKHLLSAIASSYANFIENIQKYFVGEEYADMHLLTRDLKDYYSVFPEAHSENLNDKWLALAKESYAKLCKSNSCVLAVVKEFEPHHDQTVEGNNITKFTVTWHPIKSSTVSSQAYFWCKNDIQNVVKPVLEAIGMIITLAPFKLREYLNDTIQESDRKCPEISPESVYAYYTQCYSQIVPSGQFPCNICSTSFKSVDNFKIFTHFILQTSPELNTEQLVFPSTPFGYPLLVTADCVLRIFEQQNKVLFSQFSELFPQSAACFVHSGLIRIKYSKSYFVSGSDFNLIHKILTENLPQSLCDVLKCDEARSLYPIQKLQKLWFCFSIDPVFEKTLPSILSRWALILTKDNRFFSKSCQLQPILPLFENDNAYMRVFQVLVGVGIPVVDTSVVVITEGIKCPQISEHSEVLKCLFYLAQETDLSEKLSRDGICKLIHYLKSINYRTNHDSCRHVKTLPLFENVAGEFLSLEGLRAFMWPSQCSCILAYKKWIRGYSVVFLKRNAAWSKLCSPEELGIQQIETEDMYVKYIFPHFHLMSESERYEHLRYIRDNLYYVNNIKLTQLCYAQSQRDSWQRASQFISKLKELHCIGTDGHPLLKVSDFCDHSQKIFTTFSRHFQFLPEYFRSSTNPRDTQQWMDFFRGLGLKTTIGHDEFVTFCTETANGRISNVREASSVLVDSLFKSKPEWHNHSGFLTRISRIAFLCCEKLPPLTWIAQSVQTPHRIQPAGGDYIDMTTPTNAAIMELSSVLWTVKPMVSLPHHQHILPGLSVCIKPSNSDIVQNISNICQQSKLANVSLFDKYHDHLRPPKDGKSLCAVFVENFDCLQRNGLNLYDCQILQNLPCIPVYASPDPVSLASTDTVLVTPQTVLTTSVSRYYPFLHQLPNKFMYLTHLINQIGVKAQLDIKHMQIVLASAHKCTGGREMEPNTRNCVVEAIKFIYKAISNEDKESKLDDKFKESSLSPLYLPGKNGTLVLSTSLLYHDLPQFYGRKLNLGETEFVEVDISHTCYDFYPSQFCNLLPKSIRPKGISELCTRKVARECQCCDPSELAVKLSATLKSSMFSKAVMTVVKHRVLKGKEVDEQQQSQLDSVLKAITVVTYSNLQVEIMMNSTSSIIGKVKLYYFLENSESGYTLYIDERLKSGLLVHHMFSDLAELLFSTVQQCGTSGTSFNVKKIFEFFLMAESGNEIISELQRLSLPIAGVAADESVTFSIGSVIPQEWHHRLDQDIDNLFHANEYVGFEDDDGKIIVVKIVHLVPTDDQNPYTRKYLVLTSKDDDTGTEVSVLSLYKFVKGEKKERTVHSQALVPYEGDVDEPSPPIYDDNYLKSIKRRLCEELRDIWKLDPENRRRAVRRLYLKWHPDQNLDNPDFAEKVFKFLKAQIERLEKSLPLEDPDTDQTSPTPSSRGGRSSSFWNSHFHQWNYTAHQHRRFRESDYHQQRSRPRAPNFGGWDFSSSFTAGEDDFRVPRQPEEGCRWMQQAAVDRDVLLVLYDKMMSSNNDRIAGHVCFMAHQVAEKALKAGMYAICGLDESGLKDHSLARHAYALQTEKPQETPNLAHHAVSLESYYLDTRYPNRHSPPKIPADIYSIAVAEQAKEHAATIFCTVQPLIDNSQT